MRCVGQWMTWKLVPRLLLDVDIQTDWRLGGVLVQEWQLVGFELAPLGRGTGEAAAELIAFEGMQAHGDSHRIDPFKRLFQVGWFGRFARWRDNK